MKNREQSEKRECGKITAKKIFRTEEGCSQQGLPKRPIAVEYSGQKIIENTTCSVSEVYILKIFEIIGLEMSQRSLLYGSGDL